MPMTLYRIARALKLPPTEKAIIIALCDRHKNTTGLCYPSYEVLLSDTGYEKSTVSRNLKKLRKRGLISQKTVRRSGQFGYNIYHIHQVALSHAAEKQVAINDNAQLQADTLPSGDMQPKPLAYPNQTVCFEAPNNTTNFSLSVITKGPPQTPEQFKALTKEERHKYARLSSKVMKNLYEQGLIYSLEDDQQLR